VQTKWAALEHGQTKDIGVAAAHNSQAIFFRLEWQDATDDSRSNDMADFPDQAGVMLPIKDDGVIEQMGDESKPVNMWLWRGDLETPHYVTATGRGTSTRHPDSPLAGRGVWRDGTWAVVVSRPFNVNLPAALVVPLAPGMTHKCTFAIWQGSNKERGGLKAYGPVWQPLEIER
jgi:DMSO reductase family type II enzyme heme b subunit